MCCLPWIAKGQRKRNNHGRLEFHMPFCRLESHMLPIWGIMANTYKKHEPRGCNYYPLGFFSIHPHPNTS